MTWNYWPLRFPDKATADSLALPDSEKLSWDNVGQDGATWLVNIAVVGAIPTSLQPYVIPFPSYPKRVFFNDSEGVI